MPAPTGRVFAGSEVSRLCPIEHGLDPTTHATGRLRLRCPNRFQDSHHHRDVDVTDRDRAELRIDVRCEGIRPLLSMLCFALLCFALLCATQPCESRCRPSHTERISSIVRPRPSSRYSPPRGARAGRSCQRPTDAALRLSSAHRRDRFLLTRRGPSPRLALKHVAQTPALRAATPDAQIEPATVSVET